LELSYDKEIKDKMMCTLFDSGLQNLGTSLWCFLLSDFIIRLSFCFRARIILFCLYVICFILASLFSYAKLLVKHYNLYKNSFLWQNGFYFISSHSLHRETCLHTMIRSVWNYICFLDLDVPVGQVVFLLKFLL
jgi:hypothetical protein